MSEYLITTGTIKPCALPDVLLHILANVNADSGRFGFPVFIVNRDTKAIQSSNGGATRKSILKDFETKPGFNIVIMSPIAAGVGLNVVGANNVVHLERRWNPAKEAQATDRVYRIGQKNDVNVYIPIAAHPEFSSFDCQLAKLLQKKTDLSGAVVAPPDYSDSLVGLITS